jgi:hypothetical protein
MVFDTLAHMGDPEALLQTIKRLNIPVPEISSDTLQNVTEAFRHGVGSVYAFANQIPLLEMGLITNRNDFVNIRALNNPPPPPVDLGSGFQMFLDERIKDSQVAELQPASATAPVRPLQVVAFTDHDDFLSFNLKCWYYLNVIKFDESIIARRKHYIDNGATIPRELQFKRCEAGGKKEFWDIVGNKITMSNVIVRLGFHVPWIFSNPIGAHSNYWVDSEVHRLIACGAAESHSGNMGAVQIKTCKR